MALQLESRMLNVDIRYEKLTLTCFLCGIMDHVEDKCAKYQGTQDDDYAKPYGRWFQDDVLGKDNRNPAGKWFGLGPDGGWSIKARIMDDMDEVIEEDVGVEDEFGWGNQEGPYFKVQDRETLVRLMLVWV